MTPHETRESNCRPVTRPGGERGYGRQSNNLHDGEPARAPERTALQRQLRRVARSFVRELLLAVILPLALYELLLPWVAAGGGATLMLGAVAGAPTEALLATGATLLLRVYLVVLLPPLAGLRLVLFAARLGRARARDRLALPH